MQNIDIYDIAKYIRDSYLVDTKIRLTYDNRAEIFFKNKTSNYPYSSISFDICPEWGYAPNELIIYYEKSSKDNLSMSCSIVYEGIESIDWVMENVFGLYKKMEQLSLF